MIVVGVEVSGQLFITADRNPLHPAHWRGILSIQSNLNFNLTVKHIAQTNIIFIIAA
jgi:hypothetical protein